MNRLNSGAAALAILAVAYPASAELKATLQPKTLDAFKAYVQNVESRLVEREQGPGPLLSLEDSRTDTERVLGGSFLIRPTGAGPVGIPGGLIHDWIGDVFIPNTTPEKVISILSDFDCHRRIYPEVIQSRNVERSGYSVVGDWRLSRKTSLMSIVLQVRTAARYREIAPGKWVGTSYSDQISEVERAGTPQEEICPPSEGNGLLWRLYGYWFIEAKNGGVLAENRSLSLTRSIPVAVSWMVRPFLQDIPGQALESTLVNTRKAAQK